MSAGPPLAPRHRRRGTSQRWHPPPGATGVPGIPLRPPTPTPPTTLALLATLTTTNLPAKIWPTPSSLAARGRLATHAGSTPGGTEGRAEGEAWGVGLVHGPRERGGQCATEGVLGHHRPPASSAQLRATILSTSFAELLSTGDIFGRSCTPAFVLPTPPLWPKPRQRQGLCLSCVEASNGGFAEGLAGCWPQGSEDPLRPCTVRQGFTQGGSQSPLRPGTPSSGRARSIRWGPFRLTDLRRPMSQTKRYSSLIEGGHTYLFRSLLY